jgi:hypothetical protein
LEVSPKATRAELDRRADLEGRCLLLVGSWNARYGHGPRWRDLRRLLGIDDKAELENLLIGLKRRRLVLFATTVECSTILTAAGRNKALEWAHFQQGRPR